MCASINLTFSFHPTSLYKHTSLDVLIVMINLAPLNTGIASYVFPFDMIYIINQSTEPDDNDLHTKVVERISACHYGFARVITLTTIMCGAFN